MLTKRLLKTVCAAALAASLLLVSPAAFAIAILINNGLAPPNPANVLDGTIDYSSDRLRIRNVGCPPGETPPYDDACPLPGAPTAVEVQSGGVMQWLRGYDSSSILMAGGSVTELAEVYNSATFEIVGGVIAATVRVNDSAFLEMSGGSAEGLYVDTNATAILKGGSLTGTPVLTADGNSLLIVSGTDFQVDGEDVGYGDLATPQGTLTGTLSEGGSLNALFRQGGSVFTGTIRLVPEPSTALLLGSGLLGLMAMGSRRRGR
jgi:hypothetical protein